VRYAITSMSLTPAAQRVWRGQQSEGSPDSRAELSPVRIISQTFGAAVKYDLSVPGCKTLWTAFVVAMLRSNRARELSRWNGHIAPTLLARPRVTINRRMPQLRSSPQGGDAPGHGTWARREQWNPIFHLTALPVWPTGPLRLSRYADLHLDHRSRNA